MRRRIVPLLLVFTITVLLATCKTAEDFFGSGPLTLTPKIKTFVDSYTEGKHPAVVAVREDGKYAYVVYCDGADCSGGMELQAVDEFESKGGKCWIYGYNGFKV